MVFGLDWTWKRTLTLVFRLEIGHGLRHGNGLKLDHGVGLGLRLGLGLDRDLGHGLGLRLDLEL